MRGYQKAHRQRQQQPTSDDSLEWNQQGTDRMVQQSNMILGLANTPSEHLNVTPSQMFPREQDQANVPARRGSHRELRPQEPSLEFQATAAQVEGVKDSSLLKSNKKKPKKSSSKSTSKKKSNSGKAPSQTRLQTREPSMIATTTTRIARPNNKNVNTQPSHANAAAAPAIGAISVQGPQSHNHEDNDDDSEDAEDYLDDDDEPQVTVTATIVEDYEATVRQEILSQAVQAQVMDIDPSPNPDNVAPAKSHHPEQAQKSETKRRRLWLWLLLGCLLVSAVAGAVGIIVALSSGDNGSDGRETTTTPTTTTSAEQRDQGNPEDEDKPDPGTQACQDDELCRKNPNHQALWDPFSNRRRALLRGGRV